ncbi:MAG: regulatory protein RecX [Thiohalophilus sp.]|uniref:regulatory protein RecX n=1 Tax=Thiohalophilus sp. TaxID=3028392 RepID=UPI0028700E90|nr:regulatory protein RecX [Thiohalophilus sp.]MDR9435860.1 regulatory protein RecX [Thiohalophilus sp.]
MAKSVREAAMDMLSRREHSTCELQQKLVRKGYAEEEVDSALQRLADENLLSDERFVEAFVHSRQTRGSGPRKIVAELSQKGVSEMLISQYLDERSPVWIDLAREVRVRKFGAALPGEYREKARQMRFLQQRGFTTEQIQNVVRDDD